MPKPQETTPMPKHEEQEKEIIEEMEKLMRGRVPTSSPPFQNIPLSQMIEVPEEKILASAEMMGADQPNSFTMLLMCAHAYRQMGVEPVYLINKEQTAIRVAAREMYENPNILN